MTSPSNSLLENHPLASTSEDVHRVSELNDEMCAALDTRLFVGIAEHQVPVVFHPGYDVTFFGLENFHVFDASKWGKVYKQLEEWKLISRRSSIRPREATRRDLRIIHSRGYLNSLQFPCYVARVFELSFLCFIPCCVTNKYLLRPMRLQVGGTVAACRLALERNWAVNIGGGFHHASRSSGGGFCAFADISLAVKILLLLKLVKKVIIVDLDAHQGNGHERDFLNDSRVFIVDMFNPDIYPRDRGAKHAISRAIEVPTGTSGEVYLGQLEDNLDAVFGEFAADLIVYNAGTDSLEGDPLGLLRVSPQCIVARDEIVFQMAREHAVPVAMVTSGGYQKDNWKVIANSLKNLHEKKLIQLKP